MRVSLRNERFQKERLTQRHQRRVKTRRTPPPRQAIIKLGGGEAPLFCFVFSRSAMKTSTSRWTRRVYSATRRSHGAHKAARRPRGDVTWRAASSERALSFLFTVLITVICGRHRFLRALSRAGNTLRRGAKTRYIVNRINELDAKFN